MWCFFSVWLMSRTPFWDRIWKAEITTVSTRYSSIMPAIITGA